MDLDCKDSKPLDQHEMMSLGSNLKNKSLKVIAAIRGFFKNIRESQRKNIFLLFLIQFKNFITSTNTTYLLTSHSPFSMIPSETIP
jgi:hypothetical protein